MSDPILAPEKKELLDLVMAEMEKRHFTVREAEGFPSRLSYRLKRNSERCIQDKPFAVYKENHQE